MQTIKVLIVEDEIIVARDVAGHLEEMGCDVCGILMEGEEVLPFLEQETPDLILMDISLAGKWDGITTVQQLKARHDIPVIYMTANTDEGSFARAKATQPFAFIEKPFRKRHLRRTVELLIEQILATTASNRPEEDEGLDSFVLQDRIFVRDRKKMVCVLCKDLLFIEANRAYSTVHTAEQAYVLSVPLNTLEQKIPAPYLMRVHRSFVVNLTQVQEVEDNLISVGGNHIPVSRSYWEEFRRRLNIL